MTALATVVELAARNDVGRHVAKGIGIGIIVATVVVVAVLVVAAWLLITRLMRGPVARRSHRRGSVGRV